MTNAQIFQEALRTFPGLREAASTDGAIQHCSTSFLCRSYHDTCGPNWIIVGEAASQSDPITGNGVTAALRHAAEASDTVIRYQKRRRIPLSSRRAYSLRLREMGRFFNSLIENMFYQPTVRQKLGVFTVGRAYTIPAWLANLVYSRIQPNRLSGSIAFTSVLASLRMAAWTTNRATVYLRRNLPRHRSGVPNDLVPQQTRRARASLVS
jgi:hypothetical protein